MGWKKNHLSWKLTYSPDKNHWELTKSINQVKQQGPSFNEFTLLVDGRYIDAEQLPKM